MVFFFVSVGLERWFLCQLTVAIDLYLTKKETHTVKFINFSEIPQVL